ncbi:hypothetical protein ID866_8059 [Astraeus odoratus]|nr:hypothetical protein ID866_8059 [Astraeus odoratus]
MAAPSNSKNDASGPDSDSIELDTLDDLEASHLGDLRTTQYGCHENGGHEEEWSAALLGDGNLQDGARPVKERGYYSSCWRQASDIVVESAPTLLFTTVGLLLTGELLDHVARWRAMTAINELIMIIPVILNLKGNLEMNLSARLGTAANMGNLDDRDARRKIILGNLALLQVQSTVVASVAACVSMVLGSIIPDPISGTPQSPDGVVSNSTILSIRTPRPFPIKSGQPPSGLAEFTMYVDDLDLTRVRPFHAPRTVDRFCNGHPDNIAPPVASCLGDMVTLYLFGTVSSILIDFVNTPITFILVICLILSATFCTLVVRRNSEVKDLVWQGWSPLFGAMIITSGSGIILDIFASKYNGYALLTVVMNGAPSGRVVSTIGTNM